MPQMLYYNMGAAGMPGPPRDKACSGMKWFRRHIKTGSRLALFALVVQFALSFGHVHQNAAQAAPAIQTGLIQADPACAQNLAATDAASEAARQRPSTPDTDQQPSDTCAICAVIALAGTMLFA